MLAWGFTQIGLLSTSLSAFAGYACRVGVLSEALDWVEQSVLFCDSDECLLTIQIVIIKHYKK
jgi:hypothetical protein